MLTLAGDRRGRSRCVPARVGMPELREPLKHAHPAGGDRSADDTGPDRRCEHGTRPRITAKVARGRGPRPLLLPSFPLCVTTDLTPKYERERIRACPPRTSPPPR